MWSLLFFLVAIVAIPLDASKTSDELTYGTYTSQPIETVSLVVESTNITVNGTDFTYLREDAGTDILFAAYVNGTQHFLYNSDTQKLYHPVGEPVDPVGDTDNHYFDISNGVASFSARGNGNVTFDNFYLNVESVSDFAACKDINDEMGYSELFYAILSLDKLSTNCIPVKLKVSRITQIT